MFRQRHTHHCTLAHDVSHVSTKHANQMCGGLLHRASPWELSLDPCSPPWVFCLSREGCSLFCGGRFSSRINEKLHLSHEKSIFTIYLTSCIPKAHIRHCWLMLAYSGVFWCIHCCCCDLLWVGCPPPPLQPGSLSLYSISHVLCQKTHSSVQGWNMTHN